jgi:hypothetical protein
MKGTQIKGKTASSKKKGEDISGYQENKNIYVQRMQSKWPKLALYCRW